MPNIEHIADSSISSILDTNIKTPSTFNSNEYYERYFTLKNRKYSVEAEYIENVRTPTHKTYKTLDLVPRQDYLEMIFILDIVMSLEYINLYLSIQIE